MININIYNNKKFADAVFEGGGVKGIGLVGALKSFEDNGYCWRNLSGTSAGSIVAALVAVGLSAEEIRKLMLKLDYNKIADKNHFSIPIISTTFNLLFKKDIFKGDYLKNWIGEVLSNKLKFTNKKR